MADVTAAAFPIVLSGEQYRMTPLTDRDIEELNNWLRGSFIRMARAAITDDMSQRERDEVITIALREARRLSWMEGYGAELMASGIDGMARVIWQSLQRHHAGEITHEQVAAALMDPATLEESTLIWQELNFKKRDKDAAANGDGKKLRKKKRRRKKASTPSSPSSSSTRPRRSPT
jgi:hypothetical protein